MVRTMTESPYTTAPANRWLHSSDLSVTVTDSATGARSVDDVSTMAPLERGGVLPEEDPISGHLEK